MRAHERALQLGAQRRRDVAGGEGAEAGGDAVVRHGVVGERLDHRLGCGRSRPRPRRRARPGRRGGRPRRRPRGTSGPVPTVTVSAALSVTGPATRRMLRSWIHRTAERLARRPSQEDNCLGCETSSIADRRWPSVQRPGRRPRPRRPRAPLPPRRAAARRVHRARPRPAPQLASTTCSRCCTVVATSPTTWRSAGSGSARRPTSSASAYQRQAPLARVARAAMRRLVDQCGRNAHFATLDGRDVIYLLEERAPGPADARHRRRRPPARPSHRQRARHAVRAARDAGAGALPRPRGLRAAQRRRPAVARGAAQRPRPDADRRLRPRGGHRHPRPVLGRGPRARPGRSAARRDRPDAAHRRRRPRARDRARGHGRASPRTTSRAASAPTPRTATPSPHAAPPGPPTGPRRPRAGRTSLDVLLIGGGWSDELAPELYGGFIAAAAAAPPRPHPDPAASCSS